ncbi:testis-expressed protein 36-like isoform X2 [Littorina saxatilis]|uniref:Domain of unknown function with conserved HDNR motif domain-containing protein n=1 Tax=Littorina saxatilis TaxID=31220 RepID=A0AAN9BPS0_9CAEN
MTKGRRFVPPQDREGIWFRHRGADNCTDGGMARGEVTSTGRMLAAPFIGLGHPRPPPPRFDQRAQTTYHKTNPFSYHDNRHTIQDRGEYFGDGQDSRFLGRKVVPLHSRQHSTGPGFLKHNSRNPVDYEYNTVFATSFTGRPTDQQPTSARLYHRTRQEPPSGSVPLSTTTTEWFPPAPEVKPTRSSTRVLGTSLQPYSKHNTWQYSYQGLPRVYPPYGEPIKLRPGVDNVLNRYGAAFTASRATAAADS